MLFSPLQNHCTFLDASKAFDKVLLNGLFLKLNERGALFCLLALYNGLQYAVIWNGNCWL